MLTRNNGNQTSTGGDDHEQRNDGFRHGDEEGELDGARGCDSRLYSLEIVFFQHVIRVHEESLQRIFISF